jgi:hypothetical protein
MNPTETAALITAACAGIATVMIALAGLITSLSNRKDLKEVKRGVNGNQEAALQQDRVSAFQEGWRAAEAEAEARLLGRRPRGPTNPPPSENPGSHIGG